jgi:hypothetical protein
MKKFYVSFVNIQGMRQILKTGFRDRAGAQILYEAFINDNDKDRLAMIYGKNAIDSFRIDEVECYESGDPKSIYISDPETDLIINKNIKLIRLSKNEKIKMGDFHSLDNGRNLYPVFSPESIGSLVNNFNEKRSFWRILTWE